MVFKRQQGKQVSNSRKKYFEGHWPDLDFFFATTAVENIMCTQKAHSI